MSWVKINISEGWLILYVRIFKFSNKKFYVLHLSGVEKVESWYIPKSDQMTDAT